MRWAGWRGEWDWSSRRDTIGSMQGDGVDVEAVEARAEAVLSSVPEWVWDGKTLPVPIDDIADTCFGLFVDVVKDMSAAPDYPELAPDATLSGLLLPERGEIWV